LINGVFITGTDTGVGKTTFSTGLAWALRKKGIDIGVMKPFATAEKIFSTRYKSQDTALLAKAANVNDADEEINPFFYPIPAAPFMAAKIKKEKYVSISKAVKILHKLASRHEFMIVEGIGGIMVPLTEKKSVADFARLIGLSTIIVANFNLGTMNHTLLTLKACRDYGLNVIGIIMNMIPEAATIIEKHIVRTIQQVGDVDILGILPFFKSTDIKLIGLTITKSIDLAKFL
jgi:dethiobiotin synthetase